MIYYKNWSPEYRMQQYNKLKKMMKNGEVPYPTQCEFCKTKSGIIMYHQQDYDNILDGLHSLCWRCHQIWHKFERKQNIDKCREYARNIKKGIKYDTFTTYNKMNFHYLFHRELPVFLKTPCKKTITTKTAKQNVKSKELFYAMLK